MERVLANKANWLVAHAGAEVLIVTTDQRGLPPAFPLADGIRCVDLGVNYEDNNGGSFASKLLHYPFKQLRHRCRLSALLKREKADIVVSMFCNDASFVPFIKDGSRKVLEIHFSRFKRIQYGRRGVWALADRLRSRNDVRVASRFDRFIVLTEEDRGYWGDMPNISVIPNARTFTPEDVDAVRGNRPEFNTVLAAGRFSAQKAFDRLIDAWSLVVKNTALAGEWKLRIAGDGELLPDLQRRVAELGLQGSVVLGKPDTGMKEVYAQADIYALTSLYEGLPMVLLEAQAAGLPVVAMSCKCGPRDVVTDGTDGILVPEGDIPAMASSLERLMSDDALRSAMSTAARAASGRFAEEAIMRKWMTLFESLVPCK